MATPPVRPVADHSAMFARLVGGVALPATVGGVVFLAIVFVFAPVTAFQIGMKILELAFYLGLLAIPLGAIGLLSRGHRRVAVTGLALGFSAVAACAVVVFGLLVVTLALMSQG